MQILNILAPASAHRARRRVAAGGLRLAGFPEGGQSRDLRLGLPALLFSQLAASFHQSEGAGFMLGVMLGATGLVVLGRLIGGRADACARRGGGHLRAGRVSGQPGLRRPADHLRAAGLAAGGLLFVRTAAIVTVAPMMVLYNVAGVVVPSLSQHTLSCACWGRS